MERDPCLELYSWKLCSNQDGGCILLGVLESSAARARPDISSFPLCYHCAHEIAQALKGILGARNKPKASDSPKHEGRTSADIGGMPLRRWQHGRRA